MNISNFIQELKRRNVFKVATAYAIAGWLIIQIATSVFPTFEFPAWTTQFVIILVGIGFPLTLIFAWAFELTPEGIKKSQEVDITESVTNRTGKKLNGIIITVLSMAVVFLLVERVFFAEAAFIENATESTIKNASIAVLPFVNMSSDEANEYFSDGLSEELLNGLAKIEGLQVAGRTSSFSFKNKNEDLRIIAEQLGVKYILEGSVRKDGNTLRITAQLIQADNGFHLWSEAYDREMASIFAIQEEISRRVVKELKVRLLPQEEIQIAERPTQDIEAYNLFLEATQLEINRLPSDLEKAIIKYKQAIQLDPTFALAYARLAIAYGLSWTYGNDYSDESKEVIQKLMRENIDQALLIDSNLGKAYEALGGYYFMVEDQDYSKSLAAYTKAIGLLPNDAITRYGYFKTLRWKDYQKYNEVHDETYYVLKEAYEMDPLNPVVARAYSSYLIDIEREFEKGLMIMDQIIENYPDYMPIKVDKSWVMRDIPYGRPDEAFKYMFEAYKDDPKNTRYMDALVGTALDLDFPQFAESMIPKIEENSPEAYKIGIAYSSKRSVLWQKADYKGLEALLENQFKWASSLPQNENLTREDLIGSFPFIYFHQGRYDEILEIAEKKAPEIFKTTPAVADSNMFYARVYTSVLIKKGEKERAKVMSTAICAMVPESPKDLNDYDDISNFYSAQIDCDVLSGKYKEAVQGIRNLHFELNSKANWPSNFNISPVYDLMADYPPFIQVKEEIFEDLHGMRANTIKFLKAEGEWRDEWEIEQN